MRDVPYIKHWKLKLDMTTADWIWAVFWIWMQTALRLMSLLKNRYEWVMFLPHWRTPSDYLWMLDLFPLPAENKMTKECKKITKMEINSYPLGLHTKIRSSSMTQREPRTLFKKNYFQTFKETLLYVLYLNFSEHILCTSHKLECLLPVTI